MKKREQRTDMNDLYQTAGVSCFLPKKPRDASLAVQGGQEYGSKPSENSEKYHRKSIELQPIFHTFNRMNP